MVLITTVDRLNSYEVIVTRDGKRIAGDCAVQSAPGRYLPRLESVAKIGDDEQAKAVSAGEEVRREHLWQ